MSLFKKGAEATIGTALNGIKDIIDVVSTTKEEKAKLDIAFNQLQTNINEIEAQNRTLFVAGWRPFVGWICGIALGFNFFLRPILNYILMVWTDIPQMESLSMTELLPVLLGMLGLGGLRTYEKKIGKTR